MWPTDRPAERDSSTLLINLGGIRNLLGQVKRVRYGEPALSDLFALRDIEFRIIHQDASGSRRLWVNQRALYRCSMS
ncbi:MAG: hypothetical protein ABIR10_05330 [Dokdonella sp.]